MRIKLTIPEVEIEVEINKVRYYKGTTSSSGDNPDELDYDTGEVFIGHLQVPLLIAQSLLELVDPVDLSDAILHEVELADECAKEQRAEWRSEECA